MWARGRGWSLSIYDEKNAGRGFWVFVLREGRAVGFQSVGDFWA